MFRQRITPNEAQKKEMIENVLENNLNYVYNSEILPKEKLKVTYLREPPIVIEEEPAPKDKNQMILLSPPPENQQQHYLSPNSLPPEFRVSPLKTPQNHLESFSFQKHKERQPTLAEILAKSKKIQKKSDNLVEVDFHNDDEDKGNNQRNKQNGQRLHSPQPNNGQRKLSPQPNNLQRRVSPIPKRDTKEEQMEKLKNDLKAITAEKAMKERKERAAHEEMKRKAVIIIL